LRQIAASPLAWLFAFNDRVTRIFQSKFSQPPKAAFGVSVKKAPLSYIKCPDLQLNVPVGSFFVFSTAGRRLRLRLGLRLRGETKNVKGV
jgi:hypothetical protein